jgi:8-oxo-dGTP pyrophosphatase MutT (NUDIX family)
VASACRVHYTHPMAMSDFYRAIRERVGSTLLLMPAAAAVIRDSEGRILLQQQQYDGSWSLPGGAIEPGETPGQAVVREVLEETGLRVRAESVLAVLGGEPCRVRYPNQDEVEYVVTVFSCSVLGGALIESNDETKQLSYFPRTSLPRVGFPFPDEIFREDAAATFFERPAQPG